MMDNQRIYSNKFFVYSKRLKIMNINKPLDTILTATCPACGLLCDDVMIKHNQEKLEVSENTCAKSIQFFEQSLIQKSPRIKGRSVNLPAAITYAVQLLQHAKSPLFSGMSTDVQGFRAVFNLAQKTQASIRHIHAESSARNTQVMQSTGWYTTTLSEVKNRAEVIVCIGTNIITHNPRFFERFVWVKDSLFVKPDDRKIIYIGDNLNTQAGQSPHGQQTESLQCSSAQLPEVMASLRALVLDKKIKASEVGGIAIHTLQTLAETLKQSKYSVLAWCAKDLDYAHAELTIQNITETVNALNQTTRAAGLHVGGSDGDTSVNYANAWLTGFVLNNQFNTHDLTVWINSFSPEKAPPASSHPIIVIGNANTTFVTEPEVFIPIATPGLDSKGTLFRVDGTIALPLKKIRNTDMPTLAEIVHKIEEALV